MTTKIIQMEVQCRDNITSEEVVNDISKVIDYALDIPTEKYLSRITEIKVIRTIKDTPTQEVKEDENISNNL